MGRLRFLGTNVWSPGPGAAATESQLLEWELVVPSRHDVAAVHRSLCTAGYAAEHTSSGLTTRDPWATRIRVLDEEHITSR